MRVLPACGGQARVGSFPASRLLKNAYKQFLRECCGKMGAKRKRAKPREAAVLPESHYTTAKMVCKCYFEEILSLALVWAAL